MMSDRERWIAYPLLVLSLALSVKTHWTAWRGTSEFNAITCRSLLVKNELNEAQAILQENEQGAAELSLAGPGGLVEASLTADQGGGRLLLMRRADQKALLLGHDKLREVSGLWAVDRNSADGVMIPLMIDLDNGHAWQLLPWPVEKAEKEKPAAEKTKGENGE
jgi:hypothetical protein